MRLQVVFLMQYCSSKAIHLKNSQTNIEGNTIGAFTPLFANPLFTPTGIQIERSTQKNIHITNNQIEVSDNGIFLYQNAPVLDLRCNNNIISVNCDGCAQIVSGLMESNNNRNGIFINEQNATTINSIYQVNSNVITIASKVSFGIQANSHKGGTFADNHIILQTPSDNIAGIAMYNTNTVTADCNRIENATLNPTLGTSDYYPIGLQLSNVTASTFNCTNIHELRTGVKINGICQNTQLEGTVLDRTVRGMWVNPQGIISAQPASGTRWHNSQQLPGVTDLAALHENPIGNNLGTSPFGGQITCNVRTADVTADPELFPPTQTQDFFTQTLSTAPSYNDCATNSCTITNSLTPLVSNDGTVIDATELAVAKDAIQPTTYNPEIRWELQRALYEKLEKDPSLLTQAPELGAFKDSIALHSNIPAFVTAEQAKQAVLQYSQVLKTQMTANAAMQAQTLAALETLAANDPNNEAQILALKQQLNVLEAQAKQLEVLANTEMSEKLAIAKAQNYQLPETTLQEYNEKIVSGTYLDVLVAPSIDTTSAVVDTATTTQPFNFAALSAFTAPTESPELFTPTQQAQLLAIARQCPYAGGDAVYRARSLCSVFSDEVYNDKAICNAVGIQARQIKPKTASAKYIDYKLYPNPTTGFIKVEIPSNHVSAVLEITNSLGQIVYTTTLLNGSQSLPLSLAEGAYFVKVVENNVSLFTTKLIIIK
jgi:hypothetical protein